MPGVPSGKGCDACNRQKKKCDQIKPVCSRCMRLQIPCVGSGQQRYKFKQFEAAPLNKEKQRRSPSSSPNSRALFLSRSLSNEESSTLQAFVHTLETTDPRFDLCWGYGLFIKDVPKRLGANPALDAAVDALTVSSAYLFTGRQSHVKPAMAKYGYALKALRGCLDDPTAARSPDTLCAILFIWFCQSWISSESNFLPTHGRAIVQILATASLNETYMHSEFEHQLLLAVGACVLFESMCCPETQLNPWMKKFLLENDAPIIRDEDTPPLPELTNVDGLDQTYPLPRPKVGQILSPVVLLPDFMVFNPALLPLIHLTYSSVVTTYNKVCERLLALTLTMTSEKVSPAFPHLHMHAYLHRCNGITLYLCVTLNAILRAYDPEGLNLTLEKEAIYFSDEILKLDRESAIYRPLGATMAPLCLITAWAVIKDPVRRKVFEDTYGEYWETVMGKGLAVTAELFEKVLDGLRLDVIKARML